MARSTSYALTEQETRLVELVAAGLTDEQVARELEISVTTMQRRLKRIAEAVGARSRINLVVRVLEIQIALVFARHQGGVNPPLPDTGHREGQTK